MENEQKLARKRSANCHDERLLGQKGKSAGTILSTNARMEDNLRRRCSSANDLYSGGIELMRNERERTHTNESALATEESL